MTLTEFLLARVADDEAAARHTLDGDIDHLPSITTKSGDVIHLGVTHPARVLAECEAKRRIVDWASDGEGEYHWSTVLAPLAAVYADHPDYREEWKP